MDSLARSFPGEMNPERKTEKAIQLLDQAYIYAAQLDDDARGRLMRCVGASVADSLLACASMNLPLTKALGEAYLVPFSNVCTLMVGYRGFIRLIINTGFVTAIESVLVYDGETFEHWRDENGPHWKHIPDVSLQGKAEKVRACYAVGYTRENRPIFELMNREELAKVEGVSKMGGRGAYKAWRTEMMRKAPIRRMEKRIPKSPDDLATAILAAAVTHDNSMYELAGSEEYRELAQEHSRSLRDRAEAAMAQPPPPEEPLTESQATGGAQPGATAASPEPVQAAAPGTGAPPPPAPAEPANPSPRVLAGFRARVAAKRAGMSSMPDAEFIDTVCEAEIGCPLTGATVEQYERLNAALKAGEYTWDEGDRVPDAGEGKNDG